MEAAMVMEVEDDVFFADLNRRISLLITEDEDVADSYYSAYPASAVSIQQVAHIQSFSRTAAIYPSSTQPQYQFDHHPSSDKTTTTHHQSKGTGVFIPKSSQFTKRRSSKHQSKTVTNQINYYNSYNNKNNYKLSYKQHQKQQQQLPGQGVFAQVLTPTNF